MPSQSDSDLTLSDSGGSDIRSSTTATHHKPPFRVDHGQDDYNALAEIKHEEMNLEPVKMFLPQYNLPTEEWENFGKLSDTKPSTSALSSYQSSQDLMQIIFDEDSAASGFNIRLDDDIYIAANKESALNVFGVCTLLMGLTLQQGQISFLRDELPPDNLETYRWRGDMGLLDRLSYQNLDAIPQNWNMTSLDTPRIDMRKQSLMLASEPKQTNITTYPLQNTIEYRQNPSTETQGFQVAVIQPSADVVTQPPKKKRDVVFIANVNLCRKRIDLKKREVGNNRYGRKGTWRCMACRYRRIKVAPWSLTSQSDQYFSVYTLH